MKKALPTGPAAEAQIAGFLAKFDPEMAALIRTLRTALRQRFPTACELVYDNYNFLVFGFCAAPRASTAIVSLSANASGASLNFYYGADLPDPEGILLGSGSQNRFVRLENPATLARPEVEALIAAAIANADTLLPTTAPGPTIIQSVSAKQRPRRRLA
jgi:hypothetical protein